MSRLMSTSRRKSTSLSSAALANVAVGAKTERTELLEVSGQAGIPTLVTEDGTVIADEDEAIIQYLESQYKPA